jgi:hypothetical protein
MKSVTDSKQSSLATVKRIGTGLAFILFPLLLIFGYAVHPGLLQPHILSEEEVILRAHGNNLLAFGHLLFLFAVPLMIIVTLRLMKLLGRGSGAWAGFIGAVLVMLGAVTLAAEKGAEGLTVSALNTLPESQFAQMMPGLLAIYSHAGLMVLVWGVVLLAIGFAIQAIALLTTRAFPRWQAIVFLVGVLTMGGPDGFEIVGLVATILIAVALVPYGIQAITKKDTYEVQAEQAI